MIYFSPPQTPIVTMDKGEQIVQNKYVKSSKDSLILYTGAMTYQSADLTLKSYESAFPMYVHKIENIKELE
ncbi:MAG: hypothetical protein C0625_15440 [Arcobacter sp.]|nr:MAG: hypothetical protein C0625_15440 [Arcobacter sp.]